MIGQSGFWRDLPQDALLIDYEKIQHSIGTKTLAKHDMKRHVTGDVMRYLF